MKEETSGKEGVIDPLKEPITQEQTEEILRRHEDFFSGKSDDEYNQNLREKAVEEEEAIVCLDCIVKEAEGTVEQISYRPSSEQRKKGHSQGYKSGDISVLTLKVLTEDPVETIKFLGLPPIWKGHRIKAYVNAGELEAERNSFSARTPKKHYVMRELKKEEKAFQIDLLDIERDTLATYKNR
ncbi:hypothetical protein HQ545_00380 [Candidatus Woesearchaeota archaeon]|nr:hypothetical protein [Candidatus Woesearchaeota archaeon]